MIKKQITSLHSYALIFSLLMLISCGGPSKAERKNVENENKVEKVEKKPALKAEVDSSGEFVTVKLDDQVWMAENLNVAKFRNGDIIPEVKSPEQWLKYGKDRKPAWCYYNNDASNEKAYGKLYNFFAVNDKRGLAPEGWHVASNQEWRQQDKYLGDDFMTVMKVMKSTHGWGDKHNGTNESGFNALPSGGRFGQGGKGKFIENKDTHWWTSDFDEADDYFPEMAAYIMLDEETKGTGKGDFSDGFAVRCVKD